MKSAAILLSLLLGVAFAESTACATGYHASIDGKKDVYGVVTGDAKWDDFGGDGDVTVTISARYRNADGHIHTEIVYTDTFGGTEMSFDLYLPGAIGISISVEGFDANGDPVHVTAGDGDLTR